MDCKAELSKLDHHPNKVSLVLGFCFASQADVMLAVRSKVDKVDIVVCTDSHNTRYRIPSLPKGSSKGDSRYESLSRVDSDCGFDG